MPRAAMILPPREGFAPGATGAVGLLLARLARAVPGWEATVVGALPGGFTGVDYLRATPGRLWPPYGRAVARALARLRPAIVEVHNRPSLALELAGRLPGIPVCLFLHNDPQDMRAARNAPERAALVARLARVVAVSGWVRGRMLEGVPGGRCDVLPNCLDLAEVPAPPPEREKLILFAGRVVADKGADAFVEAAGQALKRLPGWRAEMIGADRFGPDSPETPFLRALRPRAAAAGVAMLGYRPHAEVLAAMARAAIVVVPSRWPEPFGLTALEAMACGAALLASATGGMAEAVGQVALRISAEDPASMAEAMAALARDPARRSALGEAGRARAALFGLDRAGAALAALRADVLDAWSRRPGHPI